MKRFRFLVCSLFMFCLLCICGCGKNEVDTFADVNNKNQSLNTGKGNTLTVGEVYQRIRETQNSEIAKQLTKEIIKGKLDFEDQTVKQLYKKYLNEKFKTLFVDSGSYNYNYEFSEQLVVDYLKSETYDIVCDGVENSLLDEPFTCDYTDYIEKELDYDIYLKILKIMYIINEKPELIDKNNARRINYYSFTTNSSDVDKIRKEMEQYVSYLKSNYNSNDDELIKNIEEVANDKRKQELQKIDDDFKKLPTETSDGDDTSFTYLAKFTNCGNYKCSVEEGKAYLEKQVATYYDSKIVIKSDTSVLYEAARALLFSDSIEDYLYKIGDNENGYKYYLVSPVYENDENYELTDIILFNNTSSSLTYYLVEVEVIDTESTEIDQALAAELLISKISDSLIFDYYFAESDIEIYDKEIRDLFVSTYGDYNKE